MGMFDPPSQQLPNEFDCKMQGEYHMAPGQIVTGLIKTTIQATYSRQACLPYAGPGPQVKSGGEYAADLVGLYDAMRNPVSFAEAAKFMANTWEGFTTWRLNGTPIPFGLPYFAVGISASDGRISGGTYPFCNIFVPVGPPVTKHHWSFENNGAILGEVDIAEPENVIIRRDGQIVNLYYPR